MFLQGHQPRPGRKRIEPPPGWAPPSGICECGCGQTTPIARQTDAARGVYIGFPHRFIQSHGSKTLKHRLPTAKTPDEVVVRKRYMSKVGYVLALTSNHPRATRAGTLLDHRLAMEKKLGRFLESHEQVHHINGDRADNRPENLELWRGKTREGGHLPGVRAADYHCPGCRCSQRTA